MKQNTLRKLILLVLPLLIDYSSHATDPCVVNECFTPKSGSHWAILQHGSWVAANPNYHLDNGANMTGFTAICFTNCNARSADTLAFEQGTGVLPPNCYPQNTVLGRFWWQSYATGLWYASVFQQVGGYEQTDFYIYYNCSGTGCNASTAYLGCAFPNLNSGNCNGGSPVLLNLIEGIPMKTVKEVDGKFVEVDPTVDK